MDLFQEKLKRKDLSVMFKDYSGGNDVSAASKFIEKKFLEKNKLDKSISTHFISAIDTASMQKLFGEITSNVINNRGPPVILSK
jgi:guanine nucleotide-binding protein G(i) subunit alpha